MIANQCLADKTAEREAFLASLLQCEEGDMSCPLPPPINGRESLNNHTLNVLNRLIKKVSSRSVAPVTASI